MVKTAEKTCSRFKCEAWNATLDCEYRQIRKKGRTEHNYTISSTSASKNYIVLKRNISKLWGVYKCFIVIQRNISLKIFVSNIWWYNVFHLYVATPLSRNCLGI